jgi:hypothetical protein
MARGYMWCDHCFDRWRFVITDPGFIFNIRYFGYPVSAQNRRERAASEWVSRVMEKLLANNRYVHFSSHGGSWGNWWWWTPWSNRFGYGGWFYFNPIRIISTTKFLLTYWNGVPK